ncbi:MAG: sulfatase-like hydrolase/transferase [Polyangiaceae bacterium]|nr:sulfatase-like hydrolase/transferase [Polyangiaceae bacterium]
MRAAVEAAVGRVTALSLAALPGAVWWLAGRPALSAGVLLALLVAVTSLAAVLASSTWALARATGRPAPSAGLAAGALAAWISVDSQHVGLFQRHVDREALRLFFGALRARVLPFDPLSALAPLAVGLLAGGLAYGACRAATRRGSSAWAWLAWPALGAALLDRGLDLAEPAAARVIAIVPFRALPPAALYSERAADEPRPLEGGPRASERAFARYLEGLDARATRGARVSSPLDLVIVHVESLRADVVTEALMPALSSLRASCIAPARHHSTGNNTGTGMFGLLTGLNGYHYEAARAARVKPLPLRRLAAAGYRLHAHLTGNLRTWDGLSAWMLEGVVPDLRFYEGDDAVASDRRMVDGFVGSLAGRGDEPHLDYLVVDSTHYDYSYPPEHARFAPVSKLTGLPLAEVARRPDAVKNGYLNAVTWVDALLAELLRRVDASGRRGRMAIVITGDHGEAFYEHRSFGHGGSLLAEETRVAFVLCGPRPLSTRYTASSHADVMPTLFELIGMAPPDGPWTQGKSLLTYDPLLDFALLSSSVPGSRAHAVVSGGRKAYFVDEPTPLVGRVVDDEERPADARGADALVHLGLLAREVR